MQNSLNKNGYLISDFKIKEKLLDNILKRQINIFEGKFSTGIYPDEW